MKTSKILMAMALPVAFAACTSEELVESTQNSLDSRKVLGDIEIVMGEDSRFAQSSEGWIFNEGDAFGAALVDIYNGGKNTDPIKNYTLTDYIQTNYQYAKGEGNTWTTPARMVEGNYVFYAPYNPNHLSRKPIEVIAPLKQVLDVNDGIVDPYSTINNLLKAENPNPMFVAYQFLPAVDQATSITVDMKHIFAYPEVTIENKSEEDVEIFRFVIETNDFFAVKAPLYIGKAQTASSGAEGVVGNLFSYGTELKTGETAAAGKYTWGAWVKSSVKSGLAGKTSDLLVKEGAPQSKLIVVEIPEGLTIESGSSESFNIVMPAAPYTGYKVYAYTSDEEGYEINTNSSKAITFHPGKRYPVQEYNNGNVVASKAGKLMTATIKKGQPTVTLDDNFPVVVSTTPELLTAIQNCTESLKAIVTNKDVTINAEIIEAMRQNDKALNIEGSVTIEGGATAAAALELKETITISEGSAIIKGFVKLNNAGIDFESVEVLENANLEIASAKVEEIQNFGEVKINQEGQKANVENFGTLNIAKKGYDGIIREGSEEDAEGNVTYYGTVNVNEVLNVKNTILNSVWNFNSDATYGTVAVNGTVTVASGAELDGTKLTVEGGATFNLDGELEGNVELNGVEDDASTTDVDEYAEATMNLGSTASFMNKFSAAENSCSKANIVNVADGASFFNMDKPASDVYSWFEYTGNLVKSSDVDDLEIPVVCNSLKIVGNIAPNEGNVVLDEDAMKNINYLLVQGDIRVKKGVTATVDVDVLKVSGDVKLAERPGLDAAESVLDLSTVENFEVTGTADLGENAFANLDKAKVLKYNNFYVADMAGVDKLEVSEYVTSLTITGKLNSKLSVKMKSTSSEVVLDGAEVTLADGKEFEAGKVYVDNSVTLKGGKLYRFNNVSLLVGGILTVDESSTLAGIAGTDYTTFVQSDLKTYGKTNTGTKDGRVVNYGTVWTKQYEAGGDSNPSWLTGDGNWNE